MKRKSKRILSLILTLCMVLTLFPVQTMNVIANTISSECADFLNNPSEAIALLNENKIVGAEDSTWVDNTLTLNGVDFSSSDYWAIKLPAGVKIVVNGTNTITTPSTTDYSRQTIIFIGDGEISGTGTLTAKGGNVKSSSDGIYCMGSLRVSGSVMITATGGVPSAGSYGFSCGVYCKGSLTVTDSASIHAITGATTYLRKLAIQADGGIIAPGAAITGTKDTFTSGFTTTLRQSSTDPVVISVSDGPLTIFESTENDIPSKMLDMGGISVNISYNVAGGNKPYIYSIDNTNATWLSIDAATGIITGTPSTTANETTVTVTVRDDVGVSTDKVITVGAVIPFAETASANFITNATAALQLLNKYKTTEENSTWENNTLTLNGINFSTSANNAILLPLKANIVVNGENTVVSTCGQNEFSSYGIGFEVVEEDMLVVFKGEIEGEGQGEVEGEVSNISGTGSLTVTSGSCDYYSMGIALERGNLTVFDSVTLIAIGGSSSDRSYGIKCDELIIKDYATIKASCLLGAYNTSAIYAYNIIIADEHIVCGAKETLPSGTLTQVGLAPILITKFALTNAENSRVSVPYTGSVIDELNFKNLITSGKTPILSYYESNGDLLSGKPVNTGIYTVKAVTDDTASYDNGSIELSYEITQADGVATVTLDDWTVGETAKEPIINTITNAGAKSKVEYKLSVSEDTAYSEIVPTEAGDYMVRVTYEAMGNYKVTVAMGTFSILDISSYDKLQAMIENGNKIIIDNNTYTSASLKGLSTAITEAEMLTKNDEESILDQATDKIDSAINALVSASAQVKLLSCLDKSGILTGSGYYVVTDKIIVSATAVDGYVFKGWFTGTDTTGTAAIIDTSFEYTIKDTDGLDDSAVVYTALYEANEQKNLSITVGNGTVKYTCNDNMTGIWNNSFTNNSYGKGTFFTVDAVPQEGYTFNYWINKKSGRVLSDKLNYSFYISDDLSLEACYRATTNSTGSGETAVTTYYVIFKDINGGILKAGDVKANEAATAPTHNRFTGFTFTGWDKDFSNVTSDMTITAQYDRRIGLTVTAEGDTSNNGKESYTYGESVTVMAEESKENKFFSGWYVGEQLVSDKRVYRFYVLENTTVVAKYEGNAVIKEQARVFMDMGERNILENSQQTVQMNVTWNVPEGYTFMEAGLIRTLVDEQQNNLTLENVDGINVKKNVTKLTVSEGTYAYSLTLSIASTQKNLYAKGYLVYKNNSTGAVTVVYTTDLYTSNKIN